MDLTVVFFLSSGLFLGWSLGANDAANVFGTAVGTRMVRFRTAAIVCGVFVVIGAVLSGAGAAHTLGELGSVNALSGSFMAALAAALTVYLMTKAGLPVSTTQAIVGAIIGWNLFSGSVTDTGALAKILATWVVCPIIAGLIAVLVYRLAKWGLQRARLHLLRLDAYTRVALILAGAFGAYSLGANNIGNVMGVFVDVSPFTDFSVPGLLHLSSVEQLFLLGGAAIAVGVFTYSKRVMLTVGTGLFPMSPVAAWVVVVAHSIVLFAFASQGLEHLLARAGLPTIPLVPVSSSQAVVGAVVGLGLMRGGRAIDWRLLANIGLGWVTTPIISGVVCFVALFFLQNVFNQQVYREVHYELPGAGLARVAGDPAVARKLAPLVGREYRTARAFIAALNGAVTLDRAELDRALHYAELDNLVVNQHGIAKLDRSWLTPAEINAIQRLAGRRFRYGWRFAEALAVGSPEWRLRPRNKLNRLYNKQIEDKLRYVARLFADTQ